MIEGMLFHIRGTLCEVPNDHHEQGEVRRGGPSLVSRLPFSRQRTTLTSLYLSSSNDQQTLGEL